MTVALYLCVAGALLCASVMVWLMIHGEMDWRRRWRDLDRQERGHD